MLSIDIPVISIGGGPADGQLLIVHDLLGIWPGHKPKFVKQYANLGEQMMNAFRQYNEEVKGHVHPGPEQCYNVKEEFLDQVRDELKRRGL